MQISKFLNFIIVDGTHLDEPTPMASLPHPAITPAIDLYQSEQNFLCVRRSCLCVSASMVYCSSMMELCVDGEGDGNGGNSVLIMRWW